jgi:glycosyltransferase involved in cell wall biosynthesis
VRELPRTNVPTAMRAAIVCHHPVHYLHILFQALKGTGLAFEVLYMASGSKIRYEKKPQLVSDLYDYQLARDGQYHTVSRYVRARFVWRALSRSKPEVVVIGAYHLLECWTAWGWALLHGRKIILWTESNEFDYPRHWFRELPKRLFLWGCDAGHVYGASSKAYMTKLGLSAERIEIKRAVVDARRFSTSIAEKTYSTGPEKKLVYVGRLAPEKNLGMLLRSLAKAAAMRGGPCLRLTMVGTGPLEQDLRRQCSELGIDKLVEFVGYCPQADLPTLLRTMDFCVLPSIREPWGLVALEAMLCRLPILVSTQCGCAEDLIRSDTGWKFSPWNEDELAELLVGLSDLPANKIAEMGSAAHDLSSSYSPEACAQLIKRSIERLRRPESEACSR